MLHSVLVLLSTLFIVNLCSAQYSIPDITLEAYAPKGFRAYIPDASGIRLFTFNGKVNGIISNTELGQISGEAKSAKNGIWEVADPELQLVVGDKISYWVFVQNERLGYRKDVLNWEVTELKSQGDTLRCTESLSVVSGGAKYCSGAIILEDSFDSSVIDTSKWTVEQYIPTYFEEPYEYVSYRNIDACRFIKESILYLKPVVNDASTLRGSIDLRNGCTRNSNDACYHRAVSFQLNPPISSGKITSNLAFKYGRIDIRATLPAGDWIYPQMELIPSSSGTDYTKLVIGYARGNARLAKNIEDIGSKLLLGGPIINATEPTKSAYLRKKSEFFPLHEKFHTYSAIWSPDKIELLIDNEVYGSVSPLPSAFAPFSNEFRLTLGVGVGGIRDFPDDYSSDGVRKPWSNSDPKGMKSFFDDRNTWLKTWQGDAVALKVDSVKIIAL